jgi:hypothetical protein
VPGARPRERGGLAILTCSGGDSGLGADEAARQGLDLPQLAPATRERLSALLPAAATVANPLDYTALIWGEVSILRDTIAAIGEDPATDQVLVFYDQPPGLEGATRESWDAVREGIRAGAAASPAVGFGEIYVQTGYAPTPAPEGAHLLSVFGQYAPYELAEGTWDSRREEVARLSPRTPVPGLYLCGAATRPGGSVIALNGRNAARAVLADPRELAPT